MLFNRTSPFSSVPALWVVILALSVCVFVAGAVFAAILPYRSIVAIEVLGMTNTFYAVVSVVSAVGGAAASVAFGYFSDRLKDRRKMILITCATGAIGLGAIYFFRSFEAFVIATCLILPFSSPLFSQTFGYSRVVIEVIAPERAVFFISALRSVFAGAFVIVPPLVGLIATASSPFEIYAVGALAFLVCGTVVSLLSKGLAAAPIGHNKAPLPNVESRLGLRLYFYIIGFSGLLLIRVALALTVMTLPLIIIQILGGTMSQVGIHSGLAALLEIPFMLAWGWAASRISKETILGANGILFGIYLFLAANAGSIADLYMLLFLNSIATAALLGISISYMQDAILGRVGLSTSLIDVMTLVSTLFAAGIFAWLTTVSGLRTTLVGAGTLSAAGGLLLILSLFHKRIDQGDGESRAT